MHSFEEDVHFRHSNAPYLPQSIPNLGLIQNPKRSLCSILSIHCIIVRSRRTYSVVSQDNSTLRRRHCYRSLWHTLCIYSILPCRVIHVVPIVSQDLSVAKLTGDGITKQLEERRIKLDMSGHSHNHPPEDDQDELASRTEYQEFTNTNEMSTAYAGYLLQTARK